MVECNEFEKILKDVKNKFIVRLSMRRRKRKRENRDFVSFAVLYIPRVAGEV